MAQSPPDSFDFSQIPITPASTSIVLGSLIMYSVLIVLASIAVSLRFITKINFMRLGWDDWLMLLAVIFFAVHAAALMSMHVLVFQKTLIPAATMATFTNLLIVVESFYSWAMVCFKAALGVFFWRLMKDKWQRWLLGFIVSFSVLVGVAHFLFMVFLCGIPNQGKPFWQKKLLGQCASIPVVLGFGYTHALANALTDLIAFGLPIPMVWQSRISRRDKFSISFIFTLAALGSVAGIVRFFYVKGLGATGPDFWIAVQGLAIVAAIELGLGLTAASLATLRPLFRQVSKVLRSYRSTMSSRSGYRFGYRSKSRSTGSRSNGTRSDSKHQNSSAQYTDSNASKSQTAPKNGGRTFLLSASYQESAFRSIDDVEHGDEEYDLHESVPTFVPIKSALGPDPHRIPSYNSSNNPAWPLPVVKEDK